MSRAKAERTEPGTLTPRDLFISAVGKFCDDPATLSLTERYLLERVLNDLLAGVDARQRVGTRGKVGRRREHSIWPAIHLLALEALKTRGASKRVQAAWDMGKSEVEQAKSTHRVAAMTHLELLGADDAVRICASLAGKRHRVSPQLLVENS
ncbi:MAG: hypothetical protein R3F58_09420 [Steroidobacteraceae bacterium]